MGYTLEHGDSDALASTILSAYEKRATLEQMGKNAREFCLVEANRKIQTKKYYNILNQISKGTIK